ncbi:MULTISPECIES: GNAT family N-acetyltransferase [unclassified Nocardiopsis]|uniref:GNAT family N-acetyltransferase n=1 Tax=unclassified Nocardiopsis TaxID=2649073 RepID=UPI00135A1F34|nr:MULTISPECIES: GNAT family N-acetyltransferase [unclassified Nocardiopsis]
MTIESGPRRDAEWTVRGTDREEYAQVMRVVGEALLSAQSTEEREATLRPLLDAEGYDRVLVATGDDGEIVGAVNDFAFEMALPGGPRPVAGVTGVGVWPTHRRRGVLSAMMRRQLADTHARGQRYAALWASEGSIYGRFGYGPAATEMETSVRAPRTVLRPDAPRDPALTVRLVEPGRARPQLERVHREVAAVQVGQFQRAAHWWDRLLRDDPAQRGGKGPLWAVVVEGPDGPVGYALYRTQSTWERDGARGEVHVQEVTATVPAAWTALYEHLFSRDLTTGVVLDSLPVDDPLRHLLADRDAAPPTLYTSLWVRLVDVPGALSERSYAAPVDTVLEVGDRYAPWNAGRWRLKAGTDGARAEATDAAPDLSVDVSHLGAAYLGQTALEGYLRAGLLTEHTPGAVERLDAALHRPRAPFCGVIF